MAAAMGDHYNSLAHKDSFVIMRRMSLPIRTIPSLSWHNQYIATNETNEVMKDLLTDLVRKAGTQLHERQ